MEGIFVFIKVPVRHELIACHCHRKPFANSFLSGVGSLRVITIGNLSDRRFLDSASLRSK